MNNQSKGHCSLITPKRSACTCEHWFLPSNKLKGTSVTCHDFGVKYHFYVIPYFQVCRGLILSPKYLKKESWQRICGNWNSPEDRYDPHLQPTAMRQQSLKTRDTLIGSERWALLIHWIFPLLFKSHSITETFVSSRKNVSMQNVKWKHLFNCSFIKSSSLKVTFMKYRKEASSTS